MQTPTKGGHVILSPTVPPVISGTSLSRHYDLFLSHPKRGEARSQEEVVLAKTRRYNASAKLVVQEWCSPLSTKDIVPIDTWQPIVSNIEYKYDYLRRSPDEDSSRYFDLPPFQSCHFYLTVAQLSGPPESDGQMGATSFPIILHWTPKDSRSFESTCSCLCHD